MGEEPINSLMMMTAAAAAGVQQQQQQKQQLLMGRSEGMWFWCKMCRRNFPRMDVLIAHKRFMHPQLFEHPKQPQQSKPFLQHLAKTMQEEEDDEDDEEDEEDNEEEFNLVENNNSIEIIQLTSSSSSSESSSEEEEEVKSNNNKPAPSTTETPKTSKQNGNAGCPAKEEVDQSSEEEEEEEPESFYVPPELRPRKKLLRYHEDTTKWTKPRTKPTTLVIPPKSPPPFFNQRTHNVPHAEDEDEEMADHDLEEIRKVEEILSKYVVAQVFEGQKIYLCRLCLKPFSNFSSASNHVRTHSRNFKPQNSTVNTTTKVLPTKITNSPQKNSGTAKNSLRKNSNFIQKSKKFTQNKNGTKKLKSSPKKFRNGHPPRSSPKSVSMTTPHKSSVHQKKEPEVDIDFFGVDEDEDEGEEEEEPNNNFVQWYLIPRDEDEDDVITEKKKEEGKTNFRKNEGLSKTNKKKLPQSLQTRAEFHYFTRKRGHRLRYVCKYCQKEFQSSGRVSWHVPIHTGERNFACRTPNCDRRFANIGSQLLHEKLCKRSAGGQKKKKNLPQSTKSVNQKKIITMTTKQAVPLTKTTKKRKGMAEIVEKSKKKKNNFPILHKTRRRPPPPPPRVPNAAKNGQNVSKKGAWPLISDREANRIVNKCLADSPANFYGDEWEIESEPDLPPQNPPSATARARHSGSSGRGRGGDHFNFEGKTVKNEGWDEEEEDEVFEDNNKNKSFTTGPRRYCLCRQFSYGKMVACASRKCPWEWFHFPCVGITKKPRGSWRCQDCAGAGLESS